MNIKNLILGLTTAVAIMAGAVAHENSKKVRELQELMLETASTKEVQAMKSLIDAQVAAINAKLSNASLFAADGNRKGLKEIAEDCNNVVIKYKERYE
jgi:hypothetical protein